jgi:hypothetical protein
MRREENKDLRHGTGWVDAAGNGGMTTIPGPMVLVNPDGPEAATLIKEAVEALTSVRERLLGTPTIGDVIAALDIIDAALSRLTGEKQ